MASKLRQFMNKVTQCECPDDIVAVVGTNLASLDAENMVLWDEYIKVPISMGSRPKSPIVKIPPVKIHPVKIPHVKIPHFLELKTKLDKPRALIAETKFQ